MASDRTISDIFEEESASSTPYQITTQSGSSVTTIPEEEVAVLFNDVGDAPMHIAIPISMLQEYGEIETADLGDGFSVLRAILQSILWHQVNDYVAGGAASFISQNCSVRKFTGGSATNPTETFMVKFTGNSGCLFPEDYVP